MRKHTSTSYAPRSRHRRTTSASKSTRSRSSSVRTRSWAQRQGRLPLSPVFLLSLARPQLRLLRRLVAACRQALPGQESPRSPAPTPTIVAPSPTTAIGPRATPITTPAVRQTKGPRPPPTIWKAAALPNPVQLVRRKERGPFGGRAAPVGSI